MGSPAGRVTWPRCLGYDRAARKGCRIRTGNETTGALDEAIREGVADVRYRNGLALAWLRIGMRTLTLVVWLLALPSSTATHRSALLVAIAVNTIHLAVAVWILRSLRVRWRVDLVLLVAAAVDVLAVAIAGWNTAPGDHRSAGFLMGAMQLMLLFSGLTLRQRRAAVMGALCTAWQFVLGWHLGLGAEFTAALVIVMGAFAVAITWAGTRMGDLATRHVLGDHFTRLVRQHRDALAEANLQIAAQRDRVLAAQAEAETMVQLMVHDLKNPLAALQQYVELAASRLEHAPGQGAAALAPAREDLLLAGEEIDRLTEMIGDLLLISRLEHASLAPRLAPTQVGELLAGVARGAGARAEERHVSVAAKAPPGLVAPLDREMVRRLLENLAGNALRFVDRGGRVELAAEVEAGALVLAVRNTGPAVSEQARAFLFQKHAEGTARERHNVGLGLYLCRLVAEAHRGTIALVERPGWPVAFEARLPLAPAAGRGGAEAGAPPVKASAAP